MASRSSKVYTLVKEKMSKKINIYLGQLNKRKGSRVLRVGDRAYVKYILKQGELKKNVAGWQRPCSVKSS